jgi:hypothetical protein
MTGENRLSVLEAKIIFRCQQAKCIKDIWRSLLTFDENHSYPQIAHKCEELFIRGHLLRRRIGKKVYYRATEQAIKQVVELMNELGEERQKETEALKMMMINKRITEYV